MNRKTFTIGTASMWIALPLTTFRFTQVWSELPIRMATHFAADGRANGWMSRETALYFGLGLTAFVLVIFTFIALVILKQKPVPDTSSFAILGFFYFMLGCVFYVNNSIIQHNLTGAPVVTGPVMLGVPLIILAFAVIYLRTQRGEALPQAQTLAEESHGSKLFSVLFLALAMVEFSIAYSIPKTGVRAGLGMLGAFFLLIAATTWRGFRYRFTPVGLEISTLGYRLRSIPQAEITNYRAEKWMVLRGYGIRGVGNTRAYVWGNNVVHITTSDGEVFLGTNDPARTVRDLDLMKQYTHS
jgi:hypothetical protein